jgi:hypothetical protein
MNTDKIILICATGRSGSTTLERIINTIPNTNICGENYGAINSLMDFYEKIKITTFNYVTGKTNPLEYNKLIENNIKPSWYNSYNYDDVVLNIKKMIINMFKISEETKIWGFKEIRYNNDNIKYIKDFKELFPQTKVIINIRENLELQSKSGWFNDDKSSIEYLKKTTETLINFAKENNEWCYISSFEKILDINNIKDIFKFIDCDEYYDKQKILDVLNNNIKD